MAQQFSKSPNITRVFEQDKGLDTHSRRTTAFSIYYMAVTALASSMADVTGIIDSCKATQGSKIDVEGSLLSSAAIFGTW